MSSRPHVAQIGDDHVQAVVDAGLAFGLLPPGVERVAHARAARLDGEIDDAGGAAERRGAGAGLEIVGDVVPPNGMSRCVWQSMPPGMTYMPVASMTRVGGRRGDARRATSWMRLAFDQDVGQRGVARPSPPCRCGSACSWHCAVRCLRPSSALGAAPVSTCSIVMQFSTGQTSQQRLQPTHSSSSTRGMRSGGVRAIRRCAHRAWRSASRDACAAARSTSPASRGRRCGCTGARRPSTRCSRGRSRCTCRD